MAHRLAVALDDTPRHNGALDPDLTTASVVTHNAKRGAHWHGRPAYEKETAAMASLKNQPNGVESDRHAPSVAPTRTVLRLTDKQKQIVDEALAIEAQDAASAGSIGFAARVWTQLALPYRDPGEVSRWERRNGNLTLVVRPATLVDAHGATFDGYPFGVIPRYLLTWMATEAVRTQSPVLDLGGGLNEFLVKLGLPKGGAAGRRLKDQIHRLVGSTMQIQDVRREEASKVSGQRIVGQNFNVAESFDLWLPERDDAPEGQGALWASTVTLSPQFFRSIIESPIPVDLRALKALAGSPMRLDIYTWLTHRMSYLSTTTLIPWEALAVQFGGQYTRIRAFKEKFLENLNAVSVLYPAARFKAEERGLRLYPSAPHVGRKPASRDIEG